MPLLARRFGFIAVKERALACVSSDKKITGIDAAEILDIHFGCSDGRRVDAVVVRQLD
jgi:hypothetical protein